MSSFNEFIVAATITLNTPEVKEDSAPTSAPVSLVDQILENTSPYINENPPVASTPVATQPEALTANQFAFIRKLFAQLGISESSYMPLPKTKADGIPYIKALVNLAERRTPNTPVQNNYVVATQPSPERSTYKQDNYIKHLTNSLARFRSPLANLTYKRDKKSASMAIQRLLEEVNRIIATLPKPYNGSRVCICGSESCPVGPYYFR